MPFNIFNCFVSNLLIHRCLFYCSSRLLGIKPGDAVQSSATRDLDISLGNCMPLNNMPIGTVIHNVELKPGRGGQLARSAGTSCTVSRKKYREVRQSNTTFTTDIYLSLLVRSFFCFSVG